MKPTSDVTALVVDSGLFLNFARTLAKSMKRVIYWSPECRAYPSIKQACIGDGFEGVERVKDFWSLLPEIDLVAFPDCSHTELQQHLVDMEIPVWGSRTGNDLELKREYFLNVLKETGLDVPEYHVCEGLIELGKWLSDKEDQYIKISRYRGDMETHHWRNAAMDCGWLDSLAVSLGPLSEHMRFLVFPAIKTDLELGGDGYNIDGRWPKLFLNGLEIKDKSYMAAVMSTDKLPVQVKAVMDAFSPYLKSAKYRQFWSTEIRVQPKAFYFTDATTRGGMPSFGSQQLLWKNFADIVWFGAHGELVDPEPAGKFSMESMITSKRDPDTWERVELDPQLEGTAQFNSCCFVDGIYAFPPSEYDSNDLGWLVSIGNTPQEVLEKQKNAADLLPDGLSADVEDLASVFKEIEVAKESGIEFTKTNMPSPAEAIE